MKKLLFTLLGLAAALTLPAQDFKITHGPWLCDMTEVRADNALSVKQHGWGSFFLYF